MADEFFPTENINPVEWCRELASLATLEIARPSHESLKSNYPDINMKHGCPDVIPSENECAVRLSQALIAIGLPMGNDYPGNLCRHGYARGAQDLGAYLRLKWGSRDLGFEQPGSKPGQIVGKTGVILFATIPGFPGQGHIDLWDGNKTIGGEYWNAKVIWFWIL